MARLIGGYAQGPRWLYRVGKTGLRQRRNGLSRMLGDRCRACGNGLREGRSALVRHHRKRSTMEVSGARYDCLRLVTNTLRSAKIILNVTR